jgi:AcrR family transcriptional regulator
MADTRKKILDAATELFAAHGYAETSIRDIGTAAGVAPAFIHHHINSKREHHYAVVEQMAAWATQHRKQVLDDHARESLEKRVEALISDTFDMAIARSDYIRILSMVLYSDDVWELAGIRELIWTTVANNLGPIVEEYLEAHPDRGLDPVMQTAMGVFGAGLARGITGWEAAAIPEDADGVAWRRQWRDRMTAIWVGVMFS